MMSIMNRLERLSKVDHGQLPNFHITDHVLAETLNLILNKGNHQKATQTMDLLIKGSHFQLQHTPKTDFNSTQALFRRYSYLSFIDATIVAYMQRTGIEYLYSFDDDFDSMEGVTRINSAIDPR
ncbi:hypothetical protein C486_02248 [Natrinema gari JCM 14663]|uniref:PIN domain-containing protein n=2 Tax=Natrinema gari TaxID=419186 RepID=L9ZAE2_9EURY|nr:hypothetical protein C486_02248 [Natrinema gari JCM 14663]